VNRLECPLCGSRARRAHHVHGPSHVLCRCARCGLVYSSIHPTPEALDEIYREGYYTALGRGGEQAEARLRELKRETFRPWLRALAGVVPRGRILDVGCARGYVLEAALEEGWEPWGIEVSEEDARAAARRFGGRVHRGVLASAPFEAASFDAVTLLDVLEHDADPLELLRQVRRVLRPGGALFLTTPDLGSLSARVLAHRWVYYNANEHLSFFDRGTLKRALRAVGFEPLKVSRAPKTVSLRLLSTLAGIYEHGPLSSALSLLARTVPRRFLDAKFPLSFGQMCALARAKPVACTPRGA
jgi:2-polyprenyl-3-methyl-5-hydroxy-6-metoxy-1,4-benzoquinol methylase